jgi:hypothetical protein
LLITLTLFLVSVGYIILPTPDIRKPALPLFEPFYPTISTPLVIEFDRPISNQILPIITPEVAGTWSSASVRYGPLVRDTLVFTPTDYLAADTEYVVEISRILPIGWVMLDQAEELLFVFKTPRLPQVVSTNPEEHDTAVNPSSLIRFTLDSEPFDNALYTYTSTPSFSARIEVNYEEKLVELIPEDILGQGTDYQVQLFQTPRTRDNSNVDQLLHKIQLSNLQFTTAVPVGITSVKPQGIAVYPDNQLTIRFDEPMDQQATQRALSIEPPIEGELFWEDLLTMTFHPNNRWALDTEYVIQLTEDARSAHGGLQTAALEHRFKTIGEPLVVSSSLNDNWYVPVDEPFSIDFNQPLKPQAFGELIQLSKQIPLSIEHQNERLTIKPGYALDPGTDYELEVMAGIEGLYDTVSSLPTTIGFRTEPVELVLEVPLFSQNYSFTCFSVATQMVLAYYDITGLNELAISQAIGYENQARNFRTNTWGDPNKGIVGTHDGSGSGGYGSHWDPVAAYISQFRDVEVRRQWNIADMLSEVSLGYPIMVWWVNGVWPAKDVSWNTPDGNRVYTVNGMHVEVVRGWQGDINNPDLIFTNDPWRGRRSYTPDQFSNLWKWFDNTAVIVR